MYLLLELPRSAARHSLSMLIHGSTINNENMISKVVTGALRLSSFWVAFEFGHHNSEEALVIAEARLVTTRARIKSSQEPEQGSSKKLAGQRYDVRPSLFSSSSKAISPLTNNTVSHMYCNQTTYIFSVEAGSGPNFLKQLLDHGGLAHPVVAADDDLHGATVSI